MDRRDAGRCHHHEYVGSSDWATAALIRYLSIVQFASPVFHQTRSRRQRLAVTRFGIRNPGPGDFRDGNQL